jgi:CRP/FNR family cyclic AMP-dependent transcriptional regulator
MASHPHFLWKDLFSRRSPEKRGMAEILRENVLFKTLSRRELAYLSNFVYERVYQPDEPVFEQNDRGIGMYIIAKGRIAIRTQSPQGDTLVTVLNEGSFFGEIALVETDNIRTASAKPLEKTTVIGFFKPDLAEILERKPDMGVKILFQLCTVLGRRLAETTERITVMKRIQPVPSTPQVKIHEDAV